MLPTLEVLWGICTFAQSRVTNVHQLYALRFLVGMFEAPVFAGTHFILGWLNKYIWLSGTVLTIMKVHGTRVPSYSNEPEHGSSATLSVRWLVDTYRQLLIPTSLASAVCQVGGGCS